MKAKPKLGVVVPYRHREKQLPRFIFSISEHLKRQGIPYEIIIVEQDDAKQFNRGSLLNIGYSYAKLLKCKYVVFHDVDILPVEVDYNYSEFPLHLATNFVGDNKEIFVEYFGGVTMFPMNDFNQIDGYSNKYWGWGYEDTDLLFRCKQYDINLDSLKIPNMGKSKTALKFNGFDSYVSGRNIFDLDQNLTFFISFYPDDIICDHTKETDTYTIFSIPGYDTSISFNSFSRYNFCTFDEDRKAIYVNSNIKTNYKTNICVTIDNDNKIIKVYQDGQFIGETPITKRLLSYSYERFFYIGAGMPDRFGDERFFKGYFTEFAAFSSVLSYNEIQILSQENNGLIDSFGYKTAKTLMMHYDTNHIENYRLKDLSGHGHHGKIIKGEIVNLNVKPYKQILIPYRRKSLFETLKHEDGGYVNNQWKDKATRWNQLRFHNEVFLNPEMIYNDGLSSLQYIQHGLLINNNVQRLSIGL